MKKALSLFLALVIAALCLVPAFAQDEQKGIAVINETVITKDLVARYDGYKEFYFTSSVTLDSGAFEDSGAEVLLFRDKADGIASCGAGDALVILPNSIDGIDNADKFNAAYAKYTWFTYETFSVFGKTILSFLYDPQIDAENCAWYDELIRNIKPDYVYFKDEDFCVLGSVTGSDIANGTCGRDASPGFFRNLILSFCLNGLESKSFYSDNPAAKAFSFLYRLFKKKK